MKSKYAKILIIVGVCLLALITVQVIWMADAWNLKNKEFDKDILAISGKVASNFEDDIFCNEVFADIKLSAGEGISLVKRTWQRDSNGVKEWSTDSLKDLSFLHQRENDSLASFSGLKLNYPATIQLVAKITTGFDSNTVFQSPDVSKGLGTKEFKENVASILDPVSYFSTNYLDTLFQKELAIAKLPLGFDYKVLNTKSELVFASKNWRERASGKVYEFEVLASNYFFEPFTVRMFFPDRKGFLVRGSVIFLAVSVVIILALVISFLVFVKFLFKQVELSNMKSNFVNNMTHEFKTPTTNISLAVENISSMNGDVPPRLKKYMRIIGEENHRMITNVEKILEVAKYSDKSQVHIKAAKVDINEVMYEVSRNFKERMDKAHGVFKKQFAADEHIIDCDRHHFKNMISNVLDNALKYCDKEFPEVLLKTSNEGDQLVIEVVDNGPGIDAVDMKRIFDPFYRKDTGNLHDVKGFGLGLSYVKRAAEMHGGKVLVNSKMGKGSTFKILIPLTQKAVSHVR